MKKNMTTLEIILLIIAVIQYVFIGLIFGGIAGYQLNRINELLIVAAWPVTMWFVK